MDDEAARHYVVVDSFYAGARALRALLDRRFAHDRDPFDASRFAWEPWEIPAQFRQLRAPARAIFGDALAPFEARLLAWAGAALGLSALGGPPWVSVIVDGGFQALHRDSPNGEWAFSFGLARAGGPARFRGGETLLARPELLDYWRRGQHRAKHADTPLFDEVESRFNRVVAFDARVPHAVRAVEGPRDPRDGRVAIQGWMRAEGCVVSAGAASRERASEVVNASLRAARTRGAEGLLTVRLEVARDGRVKRVTTLVDTLVPVARDAAAADRARRVLLERVARARFDAAPRASVVIAPVLVGDRGARVPSGTGA